MTARDEVAIEVPSSGPYRIGLLDLMFWVGAAGVAAGLIAGSRDVWTHFPEWLDRSAGVATTALGAGVVLALARHIPGLVRRGRRGIERSRLSRFVWPIAWRVVASLGLAALLAEEVRWLRYDRALPRALWSSGVPSGWTIEVRTGLLPIVSGILTER